MLARRESGDRGDRDAGMDGVLHHRRRDAYGVGAERRSLLGDGGDLSSSGLGLEQGVVDEGGDLRAGPRHQNGSCAPPGLQPSATIVVSSTTGRHGSRFQLVLPG